jgi:hypothetical protein
MRSSGTAERSTGHHDSTDAYAATFLIAIESLYEGTRCTDCVGRLHPAMIRALTAILRTQDGDGLTWAQPAGRVKYLMDQAEVAAGLRSAERLFRVLGDGAAANDAVAIRSRHDLGLRSMTSNPDGSIVLAIAA